MFGFEHDTPAVIVAPHRREYAPERDAFPPDPAPPPAAPGSRFAVGLPSTGQHKRGRVHDLSEFPGPCHGDGRYAEHVRRVPGGVLVTNTDDDVVTCWAPTDEDGRLDEWAARRLWGVLGRVWLGCQAREAAGDLVTLAGRPGLPSGAATECLRLADLLTDGLRAGVPPDEARSVRPSPRPSTEGRGDHPDRVYGAEAFPRGVAGGKVKPWESEYAGAGVYRDGQFLVVFDGEEDVFHIPAPGGHVDRRRMEAVYEYLGATLMRSVAEDARQALAEVADAPGVPAAFAAAVRGVRADLARGLAAMRPDWDRPRVDPLD